MLLKILVKKTFLTCDVDDFVPVPERLADRVQQLGSQPLPLERRKYQHLADPGPLVLRVGKVTVSGQVAGEGVPLSPVVRILVPLKPGMHTHPCAKASNKLILESTK